MGAGFLCQQHPDYDSGCAAKGKQFLFKFNQIGRSKGPNKKSLVLFVCTAKGSWEARERCWPISGLARLSLHDTQETPALTRHRLPITSWKIPNLPQWELFTGYKGRGWSGLKHISLFLFLKSLLLGKNSLCNIHDVDYGY